MSNKKNTFPVVAVKFKGRNYMCVEGSKRADALTRANRAWVMGYDELCNDLFNEALEAPGCAFEARENAQGAPITDRSGYHSDLQAYYDLYN